MLKNSFNQLIKPEHLFAAGIIVIPAFIFQENLPVKWFQVLLFMLLSIISGKRVLILPNIIMAAGIVAANLLTPVGEVFLIAAGFPVTKGAIYKGLEKSALLIGMIYISRFSVSSGFVFPGRRGNILSLVFYYFEKIMEGGKSSPVETLKNTSSPDKRMSPVNTVRADKASWKQSFFNADIFIERIDRKITDVHASTGDFHSSENDKRSVKNSQLLRKTSVLGWIVIIFLILFNWGLLFV